MINQIKAEKLSNIPESYQKYLDEIYEISKKKRGGWVSNKELAEKLNVKPASVTGMLEKLKESDYISWEPRKSIRLTQKGKKIAMQLNEIHTLLCVFFKKVLMIEGNDIVNSLSCQIEHHINKDVKESLKSFLLKYLD